jgi:hypothetical protein
MDNIQYKDSLIRILQYYFERIEGIFLNFTRKNMKRLLLGILVVLGSCQNNASENATENNVETCINRNKDYIKLSMCS